MRTVNSGDARFLILILIINPLLSQNNPKKTLKHPLFLRSFLDLVHLEQKLQRLIKKDKNL
ncbi:hypothetical protein B0I10_103285 [Flavobacterium lacus]|uniref:Uncharacterized protein n=1 Tax=Flavobacterium lacus TaxID=1353778 RepID=A0A328WUL0_9FLAO|nr:hypothetical protein B0I10_103285 [Flavobacterium lacus]